MKPHSPRHTLPTGRPLLAARPPLARVLLAMVLSVAAVAPSAHAADDGISARSGTGSSRMFIIARAMTKVAQVATTSRDGKDTGAGNMGISSNTGVDDANTSTGANAGNASTSTGAGTDSTHAEAVMHTARFRALAHELRCLVCQNQTLLDSHADLAKDLRLEVVRLIDSGMDDRQIKTYLVDRYGEFVLYRPTWSLQNSILWGGPAVMLLAAGFGIWRLTRRRRSTDDAPDADDVSDDAEATGGNRGAAEAAEATEGNRETAKAAEDRHGNASPRHRHAAKDAEAADDDDPEEGFDHLSTDEALKQVDALLGRDKT